MTWQNVSLLDDDFDIDGGNIGDVLRTSRGERRSPPRIGGDYRRPVRTDEDDYGDMGFD